MRWSKQDLNLVNIKLQEPKQESAFKGEKSEYFHTPVIAVIIKHGGDQLQTLILLNSLACLEPLLGKMCLIFPYFSLGFHKKTLRWNSMAPM